MSDNMGTFDQSITHKRQSIWQKGLEAMPNLIEPSQNLQIVVTPIYPHIPVGGRISRFKEF